MQTLHFALTVNITDKLAARNQLPELIVVSVAYPGVYPDERAYRLNRTRDYTPLFAPDGGHGPEFQQYSGGGPAFSRVLTDEVLPAIERRFRTASNDRRFVGHSYGGLLGTYLLDAQPASFNRYLLVSPSLWYADRAMLKEARSHRDARVGVTTRVYLAVGGLEGFNGTESMAGDLKAYAAALVDRNDPKLVVERRIFEDETHDSVFPAALSTGLRHLFREHGPQ